VRADALRAGIVLSAHTDEDDAAIFLQACRMGLEGIALAAVPFESVAGLDQGEEPG
jgi:hypothetical protein